MALEKRLADLQAGEATLKANMLAFEEQRRKAQAQTAAQLEVNGPQHAEACNNERIYCSYSRNDCANARLSKSPKCPQELQHREGRVKAKEAELSALEHTTESKLKRAQQKVTSCTDALLKRVSRHLHVIYSAQSARKMIKMVYGRPWKRLRPGWPTLTPGTSSCSRQRRQQRSG